MCFVKIILNTEKRMDRRGVMANMGRPVRGFLQYSKLGKRCLGPGWW